MINFKVKATMKTLAVVKPFQDGAIWLPFNVLLDHLPAKTTIRLFSILLPRKTHILFVAEIRLVVVSDNRCGDTKCVFILANFSLRCSEKKVIVSCQVTTFFSQRCQMMERRRYKRTCNLLSSIFSRQRASFFILTEYQSPLKRLQFCSHIHFPFTRISDGKRYFFSATKRFIYFFSIHQLHSDPKA